VGVSRRTCPTKANWFVEFIWTWRQNGAKGRRVLPPCGAETNVLLECRTRIAGEDAARGGLVFICRNAVAT
jgi:hypothetical protein